MSPILMMVAFNMSEYQSFAHIVKLKSGDSLVLITTFLLTVFVNLTIAVPVGLALAMISFIKRMGEVMEVETIFPDAHLFYTEDEEYPCPQIMSFTVHGPLFFGVAYRFETIIKIGRASCR